MKIETQPRDDHQVTMTVTLETTQMESAKHRAARKISERKSVPGFRPGKAPYDIVVRTFGESVILEEAVDILLDEIYPKALEESKLEPGASGSLEKMEDIDKEPKFTFIVPLAPSVELGDYRAIRLPYAWSEPGDEKVTEAVEDLRQMYAKTESVSRPIELGDFVLVDVSGVKAKAEEGEAPAVERNGFPVFIRKDEKADEWPFAGFSKELVGAGAGEVRSFSHKFPKDHTEEELQGQTIKFEVNVKMVRGSILPDLNDEFAKTVGPFENLQALRDALKANIATQSKTEYDDDYFAKVMDMVKEKAVIKYPPQSLDHEVEHVMDDLKSRLSQQGMDMTAYLKSREMDEEKFIAEEARPAAAKRLERSLLMDEIAKAEKIEVTQEHLNATFQETWSEMSNSDGFDKYMKGKTQPPQQLMNAVAMESASRAFIRLTLDRMKSIAIGEAPELSAEEKAEKPAKKTTTKKASGEKKEETAAPKKKPDAEKAPAKTTKAAPKKPAATKIKE